MITATLRRKDNNFHSAKKRFNLAKKMAGHFSFCLRVADVAAEYLFFPQTKAEFYRYGTFFTKEEGTIAWLENTIKPNDIFYDIGANLGLYSLKAAKMHDSVKVFAFEPHKINFATMVRNFDNNRCLSQIVPISIPLSEAAGVTYLNYKGLGVGGSMNQLSHKRSAYDGDFTPAFEEIIYAMTTDDFADKVIPFPTVIKIDVDGNELSILKGMQRVLSAPNKPRSVQIEINPGYRAQIIELMEGHGYALDHSHYTSSAEQWGEQFDGDNIPHNAVFVVKA